MIDLKDPDDPIRAMRLRDWRIWRSGHPDGRFSVLAVEALSVGVWR
jgi:hypothetical protein